MSAGVYFARLLVAGESPRTQRISVVRADVVRTPFLGKTAPLESIGRGFVVGGKARER